MDLDANRRQRRVPVCYHCNQPGHIQRNCPSRNQDMTNQIIRGIADLLGKSAEGKAKDKDMDKDVSDGHQDSGFPHSQQ